METVEKGPELHAGKTKTIFAVQGDDNSVILQNKNAVTADNDPGKTQEFATKGISATHTTCRVFELLREAGIPVAYQRQLSDTEFLAPKCDMILLEVIARRQATGSYLKRHPEFTRPQDSLSHRFDQLLVEFFLKTTDGQLIIGDETLVEGLTTKEDDPFIVNPEDEEWNLFHPKESAYAKESDLHKSVLAKKILPDVNLLTEITTITRQVFWVLEAAWSNLGCRLIDFKIEFGIGPDGKLYVADVIDNDSWRLRDSEWNELSKQFFRDGGSLDTVEDKYQLVAALTERFHVPKQTLVIWRGSKRDDLPKIDTKLLLSKSVTVEEVVLSGHKSTRASLDRLSELHSAYPDGGVIIAKVGRSNGLGPILAAHSIWPVIALPATLKDFPNDVWSSVRMPSNVPMATVWPDSNAVQFAMNLLAQTNPLLAAMCQEAMESLEV